MSAEFKIAIFLVVTAGLALLTWRSLWRLTSHGLYRLFAWAAFLALVLLNLDYWFDKPFIIRQMFSWLLLIVCIAAVTYGTVSLRRGRPDKRRSDASLIGIEKTTELVTAGAYRYVRHPMYSSFLFGALGVFLKQVSLLSALLTGLTFFFTVLTAKMEEAENIRYFGNTYRNYMKQTKMLIPFLF
ncbi:MAG: isoprenylcysteine carboxylmethyltransferase family protein [Candidatus Zixiibacteriota bacterium]|nr:MAG: isoprenylcysteine carboxylmethyltransferase family protein [candidate division Zixibacteria bacterium]